MEALVDRAAIAEITARFEALTAFVPLHPIRNQHEYDQSVARLNQLLDAGASDEKHPLADLVTMLGTLIGAYEDSHDRAEVPPAAAVLRFLMEQHRLGQADLPEIASQGVVSELLNGKRTLNVRQIKLLSERFKVPASVFLP